VRRHNSRPDESQMSEAFLKALARRCARDPGGGSLTLPTGAAPVADVAKVLQALSVPYDPTFDRHEKHPSGWYHGASLTAVAKLCASNGYGLAAISDAGANAFFTRTGKLDPVTSWRPNTLRDEWSGKNAQQQYLSIRGLPLVEV
jgi:hypothetical protein